ncbi:hypothetical protein BJ508DRAFT_344383 [Ascobolus immersus RN42]|uniref:Uncharacterized protein n=1 Tax=Ascobolus immersus RN42 TaxID=1160509 RepID=A0A3N4HEF9_ASCIM|nr:hypothetical protein BJ508DRAFT_344383 [Ascobolus immersus RN42]
MHNDPHHMHNDLPFPLPPRRLRNSSPLSCRPTEYLTTSPSLTCLRLDLTHKPNLTFGSPFTLSTSPPPSRLLQPNMRPHHLLLLLPPFTLAAPHPLKALHTLLATDADPTSLDLPSVPDENKFTVTFNGRKTAAQQHLDPESGTQHISLSNLALEHAPSSEGGDDGYTSDGGYRTDSGSEVKSTNKRYRYSVGNGTNNLDGFTTSSSDGEGGGDLAELEGALEGIKRGKVRGVGWAFSDGDLEDVVDGGMAGYGVPRNRGVIGKKRGRNQSGGMGMGPAGRGWAELESHGGEGPAGAGGVNRNRNLEVVEGVVVRGEGREDW